MSSTNVVLCVLQDDGAVTKIQDMEADNSQDFQDYWNEIRIIQETKRLDEFLDEEYGGRDDG